VKPIPPRLTAGRVLRPGCGLPRGRGRLGNTRGGRSGGACGGDCVMFAGTPGLITEKGGPESRTRANCDAAEATRASDGCARDSAGRRFEHRAAWGRIAQRPGPETGRRARRGRAEPIGWSRSRAISLAPASQPARRSPVRVASPTSGRRRAQSRRVDGGCGAAGKLGTGNTMPVGAGRPCAFIGHGELGLGPGGLLAELGKGDHGWRALVQTSRRRGVSPARPCRLWRRVRRLRRDTA